MLYIDKPLKEHNLIQAIARVNRLHPLKKFGLLIDYRGILSELDTTIQKYQDLASRTQGGYDINDIAGLYNQMSSEYKRLKAKVFSDRTPRSLCPRTRAQHPVEPAYHHARAWRQWR